MICKPCTVADLKALPLQAAQLAEDPRKLMSFDQIEEALNEYALTLMGGDGPLACFGVVPRWPGVAAVWGLFSEEILAQPTALVRQVRSALGQAEIKLGLRRIETTAPEAQEKAHRWLMHLGFVPEGRCPCYGLNGETHIMYGRVR